MDEKKPDVIGTTADGVEILRPATTSDKFTPEQLKAAVSVARDGTMLDRLRHDVRDEVEGAFNKAYGGTGRLNNRDPEPQYIQRYGRGSRIAIAAAAAYGGNLRDYQRQALAEIDFSGLETRILLHVDEAHYGKDFGQPTARDNLQTAMDEMMRNDLAGPSRRLTGEELQELSRRRMPVDVRSIYIREDVPPGPGEGKHYYGRTGRAAIVGKNRDKAKKARKARRKNR